MRKFERLGLTAAGNLTGLEIYVTDFCASHFIFSIYRNG